MAQSSRRGAIKSVGHDRQTKAAEGRIFKMLARLKERVESPKVLETALCRFLS